MKVQVVMVMVAAMSAFTQGGVTSPLKSMKYWCDAMTEGGWLDDCHWCKCVNGESACELKPKCKSGDEKFPACSGLLTWKKNCNKCFCNNGMKMCTKIGCSRP